MGWRTGFIYLKNEIESIMQYKNNTDDGSKTSRTASQLQPKVSDKKSDNWYTPPHIVELVVLILGEIDLDPCAENGKKIPARSHYTINEDGLSKQWHGRVFLNPPYSCPGKWIAKLTEEITTGRVTEAIALVPGATDTNWLSPVLKTQPVCFWKGRIKFLDTNYEPKLPARQSHVLIYWGNNSARFEEIFDAYGVVQLPRVVLMVNNSTVSTQVDNASPETVLTVNDSTISTQIDNASPEAVLTVNNSTISTRRSKGEGTGRIQIRTITKKNGKQYQQAWYDWQIHEQAHTISKSTYIPKHLLEIVQSLEQQKAPVREILLLLGVR